MIEFRVVGVRAEPLALAPSMVFTLRIDAPAGWRIHAIALQAQIRVEPPRRPRTERERRALIDMFGDPSHWEQTLKPLQWAEVSRVVPAFEESCEIEIAVPCTYDLEIASSKYFHAIRSGSVPVRFLFRGTMFVEDDRGFSVSMLPRNREASFELPAGTWRAAMDSFFPEQGWLKLHRDVLDSLLAFKAERAFTSWDTVMRELLAPHSTNGQEQRRRQARTEDLS